MKHLPEMILGNFGQAARIAVVVCRIYLSIRQQQQGGTEYTPGIIVGSRAPHDQHVRVRPELRGDLLQLLVGLLPVAKPSQPCAAWRCRLVGWFQLFQVVCHAFSRTSLMKRAISGSFDARGPATLRTLIRCFA